jgi:pimeloyl-ACP methyl ester carboxylesterase
MFEDQIEHFKSRYRCISYDHRGQGGSAVTPDGYDIDTLTGDAEALIEELNLAPCHFVGLSMGGFVGMRLMETSADPEPEENVARYRMLAFIARWFGIAIVVGKVMPIMFGQSFLSDPARSPERDIWRRRIASNHRIGITRAVKGVVDRDGVSEEIKQIDTPTLIIVGEEDVATVPEKSDRMHSAIAGSRLVRIPHAGHSSTIEEPHAVNAALSGFLAGLGE